ncbi:MAG: hypothetical protein V1748_06105 [Actinomycetota bacterium]
MTAETETFAISPVAREAAGSIPREDLRELLAKGRYSCESRWMMAMVAAAGWEATNEANRQVASDVGAGEMHRLMTLMGWDTPEGPDDFALMALTAVELFLPRKYFGYEFTELGEGKILGVVRSCLALTKVRSIGVAESYRCGCASMRSGWYRAMGIEVKETLLECMLTGGEKCQVLIEPRGLSGDGVG